MFLLRDRVNFNLFTVKRPPILFGTGLIILLYFGALFWAKEQDPFSRKWFTLQTSNYEQFKCVAILPKPLRKYPLIIYAHSSGGTLINDGTDLRQLAESGLAVVSLDYNQTNKAIFYSQFNALFNYLTEQSWADPYAISWVGCGLGANLMVDYISRNPFNQPQLLVQFHGNNSTYGKTDGMLQNVRCPILLIHGKKDQSASETDIKLLALISKTNEMHVALKIISTVPYGIETERNVVFRSIGEYCRSSLEGEQAWQSYLSIAGWQAQASQLWLFCLPAIAWTIGWLTLWRHQNPVSSEKIKPQRHEVALRWIAILIALWTLAETTLHLLLPRCAITNTTLSIARRFLVKPTEQTDFTFLSRKSVWHNEKLKTLLDHVELSGYNRSLISWRIEQKVYLDFVLSPFITSKTNEQLNWRRTLWEEFYPRVRHESSSEEAARIVVRHLREHVTIVKLATAPLEVPEIWLKQVTDETGFQIIYVASLRSVGIPARLGSNHQAEFWNGTRWQTAPLPSIISWLMGSAAN